MGAKETMITEEVANFVVTVKNEDFPPEVQHIAKRCIIDGVGVILAGSTEPCAQILRNYVLSVEGKKESSIMGKGKIQGPTHFAALVNGTAGHAMDWDDTVLSNTSDRTVLLHPTIPPLVAGLALGEKLRVSGQELLVAFLVGFEVECKIAEAIHPEQWERGFHSSYSIFGATAVTSKLMGLPMKQVRNAFGIAASMASGLFVNFGTMSKPLHVGRAAENGIVSAQLSALGFDAHPDALEGPRGFFHAFAGGFDPGKIIGKLGRPFSIVNPGVSIKPYPCGVVGHPAMDTMRTLVTQYDLQPDEIEHVKVATGSNVLPPKGPLSYRKAQTALQAKFCVPFQIASMIIRRRAGIMEFTDKFVQSPPVQEMMERIEAVIEPEIDVLGRDKIVSRLEIRLKDGRTLKDQSSGKCRGGPHSPFSREELGEKFNDCVQHILNADHALKLIAIIESLENLDDIRKLIEMATVP